MPRVAVQRLQSTDSTNVHVRRLLEAAHPPLDQPLAVLAQTQTAGLGRFGKRWESPAGGVWLTLCFPLPTDADQRGQLLSGLGLRIGVVCARAVEDLLAARGDGWRVQLKWPNDVLLNGRKVLGVLSEIAAARQRWYLLTGVGVNSNLPASALPPPIRDRAVTLLDALGGPIDNDRFADALIDALVIELRRHGLRSDVMADAARLLAGLGWQTTGISLEGHVIRGILTGLSPTGAAIVACPDGRTREVVELLPDQDYPSAG